MTETPNHGYNRPAEGTTNWHIPLNENFDRLDSDVEIRDTEANKGEYEPKVDHKYEATDSGAVYHGNGDTWVLTDRKVSTLSAENVNNIKTPAGTDIDSFRDAASGGGLVQLKPGVTYEWNEPFVFDPAERDNNLRVEAHEATILHMSDPAIDIKTHYRDDGPNLTPYTMSWVGGRFEGPGKAAGSSVQTNSVPDHAPAVEAGSSSFRLTDAWNHNIKPDMMTNVRAGIYVRNPEFWSEGLNLSGGADSDTVDFCYLCLGGSYLDSDTGGGSMRGMRLTHDWGSGKGGKVTIYQGGAGFHGGEIYHTGNLPKDGWGWWAEGYLEGTDIHWESEGGTTDSVDIQFEGGAQTPPPFTARLTGSGDNLLGDGGGIINNRYTDVFFNQGGSGMGMVSASGKKGYKIPGGGGNDRWNFQSPTLLNLGSIATNNPANLSDSNTAENVGDEHTQMRFHDGSENKPAGWYWWDEIGQVTDGSLWVKIGQPSITISPN